MHLAHTTLILCNILSTLQMRVYTFQSVQTHFKVVDTFGIASQ